MPNLFRFISEEEIQEAKKKYTFFPSFSLLVFIVFFFFFVLLIFQLGIYSSMAHPTPFQNALEKSHLWVPSVDIFPKDLAK